MPFGLTGAPASFQALMNEVLREYLDQFVAAYLDDCVIYSESVEEHPEHVKKVLKKLQDAHLKVNLDKCEFHKTEIDFLGFVIGKDGIKMDQKKVQAIVEWKTPKSLRDIQVFLGFANYYRKFIKNYSAVVSPITKLTRKETKDNWKWTDEAETAFQKLKEMFTTGPILRHFDPKLPCIIETDASQTAIGAIISQPYEGRNHPIAFHSRTLSPAERNYHIHDKELLAIVEAFKIWRHYLIYSEDKIQIYTDHKNLTYFMVK
jgi:hypothetical protein